TPAKITSMDIDSEKMHANVFLKPDQVSLAIGRRGVNIKLACELTGYEIDVFRDNEGEVEEFDIDLDEFTDEIESWVIDELKRVGCDTGRSVLELTAEELERRTDLEKETITDVRRILKEEFEKEKIRADEKIYYKQKEQMKEVEKNKPRLMAPAKELNIGKDTM